MASPTIDGSVQGNATAASCAVSLTTANANDFIVVAVLCNGGPVVSVTASGLRFMRRAQNIGTVNNVELWYAQSAAALSSKTITVTQTSSAFITVSAFGVSGATGWDNNTALPSVIGTGSTTSTRAAITTSETNNLLIGTYRMASTASPTEGSGWTKLFGANFQLVEYKSVSATQSATDVTITTGNNNQNGGIGDALTGDAGGITNTITVEGSAQGSSSASTTVSASLTTQGAGLVIAIVQSKTGASLARQFPSMQLTDAGSKVSSWQLQYEFTTGLTPDNSVQVWWGVSSGAMSGNVTATFQESQTQARLIVFGVNGANTTNPFDNDTSIFPGSLKYTSGFGQQAITNAFNTSCPNAMVVCLGAQINGNFDAASTGFSFIQKTTNGTGPNFACAHKIALVTQSGITPSVSTNLGSGDAATIGFAIAAAGETNCSNRSPQPMIAAVNNNSTTASGNTIAAALTTNTTGGLIVALVARKANQAVTMSDSASAISGWTKYTTKNASTNIYVDIWYGVPSGLLNNDTITATIAGGALTNKSINVFHVTNVNTTAPFDADASIPATSTGSGFQNMVTAAASTAKGDVAVLGITASAGSGNPNLFTTPMAVIAGESDTGAGDVGFGLTFSHAALASTTYTLGLNGSDNWVTIVAPLVPFVPITGTMAPTEAKDIFNAVSIVAGPLAVTEAKDTMSWTGTVPAQPPVYVNAGTRTGESFNNNISPALPGSRTIGNLLLMFVNVTGSSRNPVLPAGWTAIDTAAYADVSSVWAYRYIDGSETTPNVTWTGNTSAVAKIWQFSGVVTVQASNKVAETVSTHFTNPGITTTGRNSTTVVLWFGNNGSVGGTPTGYTAMTDESNIAAYYDSIIADVGATVPAINQSIGNMIWFSTAIELTSVLPPIFAAWGSTEAKDVWASYGSLIGGSWRSTDLRDVFSVTGYPQQVGTWGSTEAKDVFAGALFYPPRGTWASVEAKDSFAGDGAVGAGLSVDAHATGSSHDSSSGSVSLTTTRTNDVIVLAIYTGGFWNRAKVSSITDTAGLTWKKRNQRWAQGSNPSIELWWAKKAAIGATTITVHTASVAGDPVGASQSGNTTGFLCIDALAISGANADKPWDTHTGAGWFYEGFGNVRFGTPGDIGTVAKFYSNASRGMALAFYNTTSVASSGEVTSGTGWTWLERVQAFETNGNAGTLESAYKVFADGRRAGAAADFFQLRSSFNNNISQEAIMQDVIVAASDPNVATVSTDDVIRFFFDGPGQQQIVQLTGTNKSHSLTVSTFNPDTVIVVAVMVQSALGARVDHVADTGGGSGWVQRGIEVGVPGSLSLETWWCHFANPFSGTITVTLDDSTQSGDIIGFVALGIHGTDVFLRGEIWDGDPSLPKVNQDSGVASHQTTGNFSTLNQDVLELNFAANTGSPFSAGSLQNFNEDPWLQFQGDFFGSLTGLLDSSAPNFNIAVQFKFSAATANNDHTELNVTPSPRRWLMITDAMPVGPSIPPSGVWGSVEPKDKLTHNGDFTAIGIASPGGWVGFPPNHAAMAATDLKDRATNTGAFTAIWDANGWIGYVPAFLTLAVTDRKDTWASHAWVLGPTTILARWESTEPKDRFGAANVFTWYTTPDSKGDRTSRITVTTNALVGGSSGPPSTLVNGLRANNAASGLWVTPSQIAPMWFQFDFGVPRVVNEALWFQNGPSPQPGLWKWQGSNNASTWTDLSATFVLNGGNSGSPVLGDFSSNQTAYRFYRILQTTNAGGNDTPWFWEVEFKVEGFSGTLAVAEFHDGMNYQLQLIPKAAPIPPRQNRLLIVT